METVRHTLVVPRTARYHLLGEPSEAAREVEFLLHGYGQLAEPFLATLATLASPSRPGRLLVAPEALARFYLRRGTGEVGASWMTSVERADEIADNIGYLDRLWGRVRAVHAPRAAALRVLGFSQGGATAARWAVLGSAPVSHVTLWGCPLPPDLDLAREPAGARRIGWTFVLGASDVTIDHAAWQAGLERLRAGGVEPEVVRFAGGHELEAGTLAALFERPA